MNTKRSFCFTCRKINTHCDVMSFEEAVQHQENNIDHHVVINPDFEEDLKADTIL